MKTMQDQIEASMIEGSSRAILLLEDFFTNTPPWRRRCWQGAKSLDGRSHYGSYKPITKEQLIGRKFKVSCEDQGWGVKPSIEWLDVYFDPKQQKYVEKST